MRYIKNAELREWVKDNLRKAIFQKAHALAVQTGCEVLVKLQDVVDTSESQYYATDILQKAYNSNQLKSSPEDIVVSGETGLPLTKMIDRSSQSSGSMTIDSEQSAPAADSMELQQDGIKSSADHVDDHQSDSGEGALEGYIHDDAMPEEMEDDESCEPQSNNKSSPTSDRLEEVSDTAQVIKQENQDTTCSMQRPDNINSLKPDNINLSKPVDSLSKDAIPHVKSEPENTTDQEMEQTPTSENSITSVGSSSTTPATIVASETLPEISTPSLPIPVMSPSIRPYQCGVCQKTFGSIQVLSRHAQTFHGMNRGMRYYCNICGQSYKLAQYLQAHVRMHDTVSVMPVLCKVCGMGYYSNAALKQHELTHTSSPIQSEPAHTATSPPDVQVQSKPNPRLQLATTTSTPGPKPSVTAGVLKSTRNIGQSPPDAKRFKPQNSPTDESKEESYHEPKQYHCLVCGMAFEEGEQLEEHVMKKHMQADEEAAVVPSNVDKPSIDLTDDDDDDNPSEEVSKQDESKDKDEFSRSQPSIDVPSTSDGPPSSSSGPQMTLPPFSAAEKSNLSMSCPQQLPFPPGPLLTTNPNITSVLEQALPSLLPGISLLSNPTQLPMAQAAASIAQSEGRPPMVSQDGRFTCDICGNSYKYNCTLKEHRLTHATTPLFSCKICNQAFSRQRQLRDHMFRHSGAYPYHCKLCGKGFVRPSILRRHETDRHKQAWENLS